MSNTVFTLTGPDGRTMELPVRSGTTGPDVIEIGRLYSQMGVFTYDPGFVSTASSPWSCRLARCRRLPGPRP